MLRILLVFISLLQVSFQVGFQKELNVNIPFPPILVRHENIATGHLRPLGWQNRAEAPVAEEASNLGPEKFWDLYINKSKPVVFRGLVFGSDAVDRWTDIYLNRAYGYLDIKVSQRRQTIKTIEDPTEQMSLKAFLQGYRVENWYLRGIMPDDMLVEVPVPHLLSCGPFVQSSLFRQHEAKTEKDSDSKKNKIKLLSGKVESQKFELPKIAQLVEPYFWLSAGDTSSLIHSHPEHNLHCVLDGRKDFIVIPEDQFTKRLLPNEKKDSWRKKLDLVETFPHSSEWFSKIDVDMVNAYKYSVLNRMIWYWASLRAGDCIYLPANYLHQVRSHGRSLSSSIYFNLLKLDQENEKKYDSIKKELFSQCPTNAPLFTSVSTISSNFLWTYTHSERHLNLKNIQIADARVYLNNLIDTDKILYFERFEKFYNEITSEMKKQTENFISSIKEYISLGALDYWNEFLKETDSKEEKYLTVDQVAKISSSRFVRLLNIVANYHDLERSYKIRSEEL